MTLSSTQLQRVNEWFQSKGVRGGCPTCRQVQWLRPELLTVSVLHSVRDDEVPLVAMTCGNCSTQMHFSAVMMGVS